MYENSYNLRDLDGLITNTYIFAVVVAIAFVGISMLVAKTIAYEGGRNPGDPRKRRIWFFVLAGINAIAFFLWNFLYVAEKVKGAPAQSKFLVHSGISTGVAIIVFIILGFVLSKLIKKGKYGTIFPSK